MNRFVQGLCLLVLVLPLVACDEDPEVLDAPEPWTDASTGLVWQDPPSDLLLWMDTETYCGSLDLGGFTDWRVPTIDEVRTLLRGCAPTESGGLCRVGVGCYGYNACYSEECDRREAECPATQGPAEGCYRIGELRGNCSWLRSSSNADYEDMGPNRWSVDFRFGSVVPSKEGAKYAVRCVRSGG